MRVYLRLASMLLTFLFVVPVLAQKVDIPNPDKNDDTKIRLNLLKNMAKDGKFIGKLTEMDLDGEDAIFVVTIEYEVKTPNPDGEKKFRAEYPNVYRGMQDAVKNRDANRYKQLYDQAAALMAGRYDVDKKPFVFKGVVKGAGNGDKKDAEEKKDDKKDEKKDDKKADKADKKTPEKTAEKSEKKGDKPVVVVRRMELPPKDPDDPKARYTEKEKRELKGDPKLPGYMAEVKDLETDMVLAFYVDKMKLKIPGTKPVGKGKDKDKEAKEDETPLEDLQIPLTMIIIPPPPKETGPNPLLGGK